MCFCPKDDLNELIEAQRAHFLSGAGNKITEGAQVKFVGCKPVRTQSAKRKDDLIVDSSSDIRKHMNGSCSHGNQQMKNQVVYRMGEFPCHLQSD